MDESDEFTLTEDPLAPEPFRAWRDPRGVKYGVKGTPGTDWLTTASLADEFGMHLETVYRWCRRWFGPLPKGRKGAGQGYRIPPEYVRVARAWLQIEDYRLRSHIHKALVESPKDWVVVVDNIASTHYSVSEVVNRIESLTTVPTFRGKPLFLIYTGE